jgi:hypothetical protein
VGRPRPAAPRRQPPPAVPQPAAPHGQPRPAALHGQPPPAVPQPAAPHGQPRPAAPHGQPPPAAPQPPPLPYDQDPRWAGQMPGAVTAAFPLPPGSAAPNQFGPHPPGPPGFGPPGGPGDPRAREAPRRKKWLLPAAAAVAVALLWGIAIVMTGHSGGTAGHAVRVTPTGSRTTDAGAAGRGGHRADARHRITTRIFPRAHVVADGIKFGRVIAVVNKDCTLAARAAFASALKSVGCSQVARATFVDNAKRYAITAGVAELPSSAAASQADRSRNFGPDVWFTGLDGPARSGATAVSKSVGLGYEIVHGPYIVYSLATYSSGRNPTGHAAAVRTLKDLARSFAVMTRQPLTTDGK